MKTFFTTICLFGFLIAECQTNLVNNSSFENHSSCPTFGAQWNLCTGWNNVNLNTGVGAWGTPDYFHTCGSSGVTPPNTFAGPCSPHTGNAMMALVLYNSPYPDYREYLSTQLSCSMQVGATYTVSFWITNGTNPISPWTIKNIGIHFSNSPLNQSGWNYINVVPQCEVTTTVGSTSWVQYSFTVNPTSGWSYITIGSFRQDISNSPTQTFPNQGGAPSSYANYFIDDIEVLGQGAPAMTLTSNNSSICAGNTATLSASGANSYTWNTNSNSPVISVTPSVTTTYTVVGSPMSSCASNTAAITISVIPIPTITISPVIPLCAGHSTILTATGANSYTWSLGATVSPTLSVAPNVTTSYTVTGSSAQGCKNSAVTTVSVTECTGISENRLVAASKIYPSPFSDKLTIEIPNSEIETQVVITNLTGQIQYSGILDSKTIDLGFLQSGIYYARITQGETIHVQKILKE